MYDGRNIFTKKEMMIENILKKDISGALVKLYSAENQNIQFQKTRNEFEGDVTLIVFPLLFISNKSPEKTGKEIGQYLKENISYVSDFNVIKGFLNIVIKKDFWINQFLNIYNISDYGVIKVNEKSPVYLVEYSSPNTNKPIHLGHLRNNFLGYSVAEILKASGKKVKKVQIINDRGIHICKSMVAWQESGNNDTPESTGLKGDHLVGKYYVEFTVIETTSNGSQFGVGTFLEKHHTGNQNGSKTGMTMLNIDNGSSDWRVVHVDGTSQSATSDQMNTPRIGSVIGIAFDADRARVRFYVDGYQWGEDEYPVTMLTNEDSMGKFYFFATSRYNGNQSAYSANYGQLPFTYAPPEGYLPLSVENLHVAEGSMQPEKYHGAITWEGK